jgi:hypothetical protein
MITQSAGFEMNQAHCSCNGKLIQNSMKQSFFEKLMVTQFIKKFPA